MRAGTEYHDVQVDYRLATSLRRGDDRRLREALDARRAAEAEGGTRNRARGGRS